MGYEVFDELRKAKGMTIADVSRATGIDKAYFSHWKRGDYEPKFAKKKVIADYFGVTVEYLETGETKDPVLLQRKQMSEDEKMLADLAAKADPEQVKLAVTFLKTIMGE
jgi:transcriptional regulator with XRE-family HTH domain